MSCAWRRIINVPARKIGDKSVETAMQAAVENGVTLYDVVCHASEYPALSRGAAAMEKFGEMIENLRRLREFVSLSELYDELLDKSGYLRALQLKGGAGGGKPHRAHRGAQVLYRRLQRKRTKIRRLAISSKTWRFTPTRTSRARMRMRSS